MTEFGAEARPELADDPVTQKGSYAFQTFHARRTLDVVDRSPVLSGAIYWTLREFEIYPGLDRRRRAATAAVPAQHPPPEGPASPTTARRSPPGTWRATASGHAAVPVTIWRRSSTFRVVARSSRQALTRDPWLRLRVRAWPILQTAAAAVGAWYLAKLLLPERAAGFASIAAVIALGADLRPALASARSSWSAAWCSASASRTCWCGRSGPDRRRSA